MKKQLTKKQAYALIDKRLSSILNRTPNKYWNTILDSLALLGKEPRYFVQIGFDEDKIDKWFKDV